MTDLPRQNEKWIVFSGGGTGGHLTQAMAVAEQVKKNSPHIKIAMMCSDRAIDAQMLQDSELFDSVIAQKILPLPSNPLRLDKWFKFLLHWNISYKQARRFFNKIRPECVLGFGGFAAAAAIVCGNKQKIPTALLNPDSIPGKANLKLAKYSDKVFISFEMSRKFFAEKILDENIVLSGCPVRGEIVSPPTKEQARTKFSLDPHKKIIGVMGGSLGAKNVNDAVVKVCSELSDSLNSWAVLHVAGSGKAADLQEKYNSAGVDAKVVEFCRDMGSFYAACDLVVARGGANSVAELAVTGTASIIFPYPWHNDMHQKHNAADLAQAGAAIIIDDRDDLAANASALKTELEKILNGPNLLKSMAESAGKCAKADAAETVARQILGQ